MELSNINYDITENFNKLLTNLLEDELSVLDIKFIKFLKYINDVAKNYPKPSLLRIITRSTAANLVMKKKDIETKEKNLILFTEIDTLSKILYEDIKKSDRVSKTFIGLQYKDLEYNYAKKKNKVKKKNQFYNCFSLKIQATPTSIVNMKFFNNGSITMTGCIEDISAENAIKKIIKYLKKNNKKFKNPEYIKNINFSNLRTTMVNYNFKLNFSINRDKLYFILKNNHDLFVSYEPEKYQAVKISYMYNKTNIYNDGICYCSKKCTGKGWGNGDGDCKKVTIAIFQSGNTGINGSRSLEQIKSAYNFINQIIKEYYKDIVRYSILNIDNYEVKNV